jgi:WD40 repeat protein
VRTLTGGSEHIYSVAFSADGQWLASGGRARSALGTLWHQIAGNRWSDTNQVAVRLWRVSDGALEQKLDGYADDVWSIALSPDGRWLASSGEDNQIRTWRLTVHTPLQR